MTTPLQPDELVDITIRRARISDTGALSECELTATIDCDLGSFPVTVPLGTTIVTVEPADPAGMPKLTATCTCGKTHLATYGYDPDCAVHGAVRAFHKVQAEVERLREFVQSVPISALDFSARAYNALMRAGHRTVGELVKLNGHDLLDIRGFGTTSLAEVIGRLGEHGLQLQEPPCPLPPMPTRRALNGGER